MSKNTKKSGFIGVLVGAVAGVVAGVFALAPKGAKENREDLKKSAAKLKADSEKQLRSMQTELESQIEQMTARYKSTRGKVREEWEGLMSQAEETLDKVKTSLNREESKDSPETIIDKTKAFVKEVGDKLNQDEPTTKKTTKKK